VGVKHAGVVYCGAGTQSERTETGNNPAGETNKHEILEAKVEKKERSESESE